MKISNAHVFILCIIAFILVWQRYTETLSTSNNYNAQSNNIKHAKDDLDSSKNFIFNDAYKPNPKKIIIFLCLNPCNYSVSCLKWTPCNGLGDRLEGISSAFIWSILTNRTFLIHYTRPCPLQEYLQPNKIKWNKNVNEIINAVDNKTLSSANVILGDRKYDKALNLLVYKQDKDVIFVRSASDITFMLHTKSIYHERLKELGFDEPKDIRLAKTFYYIYNSLFKLAPRLQKQFDEFKAEAKPSIDSKLLCLQIRSGGKLNTFTDPVRTTNGSVQSMLQFATSMFIKNAQPLKIFVTSDNDDVIKYVKNYFDKFDVLTTNGTTLHLDKTVVKLHDPSVDCPIFDKTYLDLHAMSACDMAIVSYSSFSRLGMWNRPPNTSDNIYSSAHQYKFRNQYIRMDTFQYKF